MKTKQAIILRKDLNMRKGKMVAQGAHASMAVLLNKGHPFEWERGEPQHCINLTKEMEDWIYGKFTKICLSVNSEEELLAIHKQAEDAGLICSLIQDAGLTEFDGVPTYTAVAIGPEQCEDVDKITSELKLL